MMRNSHRMSGDGASESTAVKQGRSAVVFRLKTRTGSCTRTLPPLTEPPWWESCPGAAAEPRSRHGELESPGAIADRGGHALMSMGTALPRWRGQGAPVIPPPLPQVDIGPGGW